MEHRFTDTPDGSLAGAWWQADQIRPLCVWSYEETSRLIHVERGAAERLERFPLGEVPVGRDELFIALPKAALLIAKELGDAQRTRESK
jgi:hypothetical protein